MKAMSRRLHRLPEAVAPAERPIVVVFVLAEATSTPEADRPAEAEATPDEVLPHLDFDLAIRLFDELPSGNTRKAYTSALRGYESWLDGRPPTDPVLAEYLGAMYNNSLAPQSGATVVAAVKCAALVSARAGHEIAEPPAGDLAAQRLERYRREGVGRGRGQAGALRWEDADEMCECAEADEDPHGVRDAALIGVISSALLRIAEASALDAGDVSFQEDGSAHIEIRQSNKTDQHGDGEVGYLVPAAAARLRKWMDTAGIGSGPLFRPVSGRRVGETRLGAAAICGVIKRRAKQAGIMRRVSGHSLRVGAAQSLVEAGASLVDVQVAGRWKSPSMPAYYVRNQEASRGAVARLRGGAGQAAESNEKKVAESACNPRNGGANVE